MSNHIEFRLVNTREPSAGGGGYQTVSTRLQFRTREIVPASLGSAPLSASWSEWSDIQEVLLDAHGNPSE